VWGNRLAFERAGITRNTPAPPGGEIKKDANGEPTGVLLNNAAALLTAAVPPPSPTQLEQRVVRALAAMAAHGYTSVHEAGADAPLLAVLEDLDRAGRLPLPVNAMIAARDTALIDGWRARQPTAAGRPLTVRSVKAFYDGAMGSRGAFFLEPYTDRPDHHGVGGAEYGFDRERLAAMMTAGLRGWTVWAAYAGFREQQAGTIAAGHSADLTVMDLDPFQVGETAPARLLGGRIVMTIANGRVVHTIGP
jgi:predicted amidohydrolase YtcJ